MYDKKKLFEERLAASIALDNNKEGIEYFGYNGDNSDAIHRAGPDSSHDRRNRRDWCNRNDIVTYMGGT